MIIKSCTLDYHGANILVFRDLSKLFTAKGLRFNKFYSFIFHHNQPCGRRRVRGTRVRGTGSSDPKEDESTGLKKKRA